MLKKMIKYDLKWMFKILIIFYALSLIFAILTRTFLEGGKNSTILNVVGLICQGVTISMMINIIINTILRSFSRFITSNYKDESYLIHTLPIKRSTNYLSKVLASLITMFIGVAIVLISLVIMYYSKENIKLLGDYLNVISKMYNSSTIGLILIVGLVFFLEMSFTILVGYVSIILGHRANNGKVLRSIIYGFLLYMGTQGLMLLIIYLIGLFNPSIMNLFTSNMVMDISVIKLIMFVSVFIYLVYNVIYYFAGQKLFNKGVNVD